MWGGVDCGVGLSFVNVQERLVRCSVDIDLSFSSIEYRFYLAVVIQQITSGTLADCT